MYKSILIDLDDTLWATQENNKEALRELYLSEGWSSGFASFDLFWEHYYPNNEALWHSYRHGDITKQQLTLERFRQPLSALRPFTDEEILALNERFLNLTKQKRGVIDGAIDLLKHLKQFYRVVIVSNGFIEVQHSKLRNSGLAPYVDHVVLSEEVGANKPSKAIFDAALSISHTRRSEAIMVGDSWDADILGAQQAKLPSIWFAPHQRPMPSTPLRYPVERVTHLAEIPALLWK